MLELKTPEKFDILNAKKVESEFISKINADESGEVVIDFSKTTYISSVGLRTILVVSKKLDETGGKLTLRNMDKEVLSIFQMAGFDTILNIE
jgi:anti-anti-sigma factor